MSRTDAVITIALTVTCGAILAIGGLYHPASVAGSIARFVFSL